MGTSTFRWTNENFPPRFDRDSKMSSEDFIICTLTCTYSPHRPPSSDLNGLENDLTNSLFTYLFISNIKNLVAILHWGIV